MSEDWDVDAYKSEFENEEHWQLRRNFMLAHKDKFPEDELVSLAQVFTNIEFMGCRYPDKTMIRVAELAKGVVEKFREQRKNSLKRTFVAASDAASAKVKGQTSRGEEPSSTKKSKQMDETGKNSKQVETTTVQQKQRIEPVNVRVPKYGGVKTFNIKKKEKPNTLPSNKSNEEAVPEVNKEEEKMPEIKSGGPLGDFVLILGHADERPDILLSEFNSLHSVVPYEGTFNFISDYGKLSYLSTYSEIIPWWDFDEAVGGMFVCRLFLNEECIATSTGISMKMSKEYTAMVAIAKLRESYYGIRVKPRCFSDRIISPAQLGGSTSQISPAEPLGEDNVGRKLMKLMGWQGGGLGSRGQGIEEPVKALLHVKREGIGLSKSVSNLAEFKKRAKDYVVTWMNGNSVEDLVFSSDFSLEERKILHEIASNLSLKSKSYGKDANRQLVISKKCDPWEILKELLRKGGHSDKYELLYPTNNEMHIDHS